MSNNITVLYNGYKSPFKRLKNYKQFKAQILKKLFINESSSEQVEIYYREGNEDDPDVLINDEDDYKESLNCKAELYLVELNEPENNGEMGGVNSSPQEPRFPLPLIYRNQISAVLSSYKSSFASFLKEKGEFLLAEKIAAFLQKTKEKRRKIKEEIRAFFSEKLREEAGRRKKIFEEKMGEINNLGELMEKVREILREVEGKKEKNYAEDSIRNTFARDSEFFCKHLYMQTLAIAKIILMQRWAG